MPVFPSIREGVGMPEKNATTPTSHYSGQSVDQTGQIAPQSVWNITETRHYSGGVHKPNYDALPVVSLLSLFCTPMSGLQSMLKNTVNLFERQRQISVSERGDEKAGESVK